MVTQYQYWRCIPCGATSNTGPYCHMCGRTKEAATDESRWTVECDHVWMHDLEPSLAHECEQCGLVADCECGIP